MRHSENGTGPLPVLVIFAPTACGKTSLALQLFGKDSESPFAGCGELISADSMQVYQGMDIGTAKPTAQELLQLPHHLIDLLNPDVPFSAGEFVRRSDQLCQEIDGRGHLPVVLGGTGFYIRNFLCGLPPTPQADPDLRFLLQQRMEQEGPQSLYRQLQELDPVASQRIHCNDHYRILRALEVCLTSGRPQSSFFFSLQLRNQFKFCIIILWRERQELYQRIDQRVVKMMEEGLPQEVDSLLVAGYKAGDPGMQAIGYREFLLPEIQELDEPQRTIRIQELICRDSRRYAKRQYAYFKGIPQAQFFHADDKEAIQLHIGNFIREFFPLLTQSTF